MAAGQARPCPACCRRRGRRSPGQGWCREVTASGGDVPAPQDLGGTGPAHSRPEILCVGGDILVWKSRGGVSTPSGVQARNRRYSSSERDTYWAAATISCHRWRPSLSGRPANRRCNRLRSVRHGHACPQAAQSHRGGNGRCAATTWFTAGTSPGGQHADCYGYATGRRGSTAGPAPPAGARSAARSSQR